MRSLGPDGLTTSRLSEVEVASALARRRREGVCTAGEHDLALQELGSDMSGMSVLEIASGVAARAHDIVARHPLRAGDAIHLASCLLLQDTTGQTVELVAFDRKLRAAAEVEGLPVVPDELEP